MQWLHFPTIPPDRSAAPPTSDAVLAVSLRDGTHRWVFQALVDDAFNHGCFGRDTANCPAHPGPDYDIGTSIIGSHQLPTVTEGGVADFQTITLD